MASTIITLPFVELAVAELQFFKLIFSDVDTIYSQDSLNRMNSALSFCSGLFYEDLKFHNRFSSSKSMSEMISKFLKKPITSNQFSIIMHFLKFEQTPTANFKHTRLSISSNQIHAILQMQENLEKHNLRLFIIEVYP